LPAYHDAKTDRKIRSGSFALETTPRSRNQKTKLDPEWIKQQVTDNGNSNS
jgi:hypothetical protein